jgi:hypothetical protein
MALDSNSLYNKVFYQPMLRVVECLPTVSQHIHIHELDHILETKNIVQVTMYRKRYL